MISKSTFQHKFCTLDIFTWYETHSVSIHLHERKYVSKERKKENKCRYSSHYIHHRKVPMVIHREFDNFFPNIPLPLVIFLSTIKWLSKRRLSSCVDLVWENGLTRWAKNRWKEQNPVKYYPCHTEYSFDTFVTLFLTKDYLCNWNGNSKCYFCNKDEII